MNSWVKAALVTVVSAAGIGFVAGSIFGGPGPLPDVGAPVVMEVATADEAVGSGQGDRTEGVGGIVHPDPVEQARDRREEAAERRADRREARAGRREEAEQRRADRPDPRPVYEDDDGDDGDDGGGDEDDDDGDDDD
jgi:hypothetical protein